ncbi:hypothetical protein ACHHYP_07555 [Achlya hypogyna]|uniref:RGS domain-containing protein n=1 Tax=Achlya hypogyna TaxID=1202772 RepID=A0A1V9YQQ6_ACHHY|nr:hypothetical protein ACHHYP_07555 [Achlya hypogyna]
MLDVSVVPVGTVSAVAFVLVVRLVLGGLSPLLLTFGSIRGRKYDWYLYAMSFVTCTVLGMCVAVPVVVALAEGVPCTVGFVLRFVLPAFTSGAYLLGHATVLLVFARAEKPQGPLCVVSVPKVPSQRVLVLALVAYMSPLGTAPAELFALDVAACRQEPAFHLLGYVQLGQACVSGLVAGYLLLQYRRTHGKAMGRFHQVHSRTSRALLASLLVVALAVAAVTLASVDAYAYYVDLASVLWLQFTLAYWYLDGYSKSRRVAGVGPHTISARSARNSARSLKSTGEDADVARSDLDDLRRFLALDDYFADLLAFAEGLGRTHELLAWRLMQLYKTSKVPPATVYHNCMAADGTLVTMAGLAMAPRVVALMASNEPIDELYAAFEMDLVRAVCHQVLPKYQRSGRLWYSFLQRPSHLGPRESILGGGGPGPHEASVTMSTLLPTTNERGSDATAS